jgi:hypothetical protein
VVVKDSSYLPSTITKTGYIVVDYKLEVISS